MHRHQDFKLRHVASQLMAWFEISGPAVDVYLAAAAVRDAKAEAEGGVS
jgi:hypothetical protein